MSEPTLSDIVPIAHANTNYRELSESGSSEPQPVEPMASFYQSKVKRHGKLKIPLELFDIARDYLASLKQAIGNKTPDEEIAPVEVVVTDNISQSSFLKFVETAIYLPVRIHLTDGKIIAEELTAIFPHGELAAAFIRIWDPNVPLNNRLYYMTETKIIVGANTVVACDVAIVPRQRAQPPAGQGLNQTGRPYPTLVVEIGNSQQLQSLDDKATLYFSPITTIQLYLVINCYETHGDGTRQLIAILYRRSNPNPMVPVRVVSFGTRSIHHTTVTALINRGVPPQAIVGFGRSGSPPCNALGIPIYQLDIPIAEVYNGVPGGPPACVATDLDLFELRDEAGL